MIIELKFDQIIIIIVISCLNNDFSFIRIHQIINQKVHFIHLHNMKEFFSKLKFIHEHYLINFLMFHFIDKLL